MNKSKKGNMEEKKKFIKIAIVGLGYVGLPLAVEFSKQYTVIGFDKDKKRITRGSTVTKDDRGL